MKEGDPEIILDLSGLLCPLPVLKARKVLQGMPSGSLLQILATDPMAAIDLPHFCAEHGHELLDTTSNETTMIFRIRRK